MSIKQRLAAINKIDLLQGPTPLAKLNNLSEYLGRDIYIKRDDMTPLAMGAINCENWNILLQMRYKKSLR